MQQFASRAVFQTINGSAVQYSGQMCRFEGKSGRGFGAFTIFSERSTVDHTALHEKRYVNFCGLKQEQRCSFVFETCLAIWKIYLAGTFFLLHASSGFSGSFTAMR
jgi:hypothetical protein